ncbi:MAG: hypothetical protein H7839_21365, partial [Magnetococcus sp. YQC-5]
MSTTRATRRTITLEVADNGTLHLITHDDPIDSLPDLNFPLETAMPVGEGGPTNGYMRWATWLNTVGNEQWRCPVWS